MFFAREQTAGKGQQGKTWDAEKDANILMSLVLKPHTEQPARQFELSACVAVSVQEFFSQYAGDQTKIKWPNDLYWQDRKAGGILIESGVGSETSDATGTTAGWKWSIAGIGININQTVFPGSLPNPVSLKQITGRHFDPVILAKELCGYLDKNYTQLVKEGPDDLFRRYNKCLYKKDESVRLKKDNRIFEARIRTVSPDGKLHAVHAWEEAYAFGEIEWLPETTQ